MNRHAPPSADAQTLAAAIARRAGGLELLQSLAKAIGADADGAAATAPDSVYLLPADAVCLLPSNLSERARRHVLDVIRKRPDLHIREIRGMRAVFAGDFLPIARELRARFTDAAPGPAKQSQSHDPTPEEIEAQTTAIREARLPRSAQNGPVKQGGTAPAIPRTYRGEPIE